MAEAAREEAEAAAAGLSEDLEAALQGLEAASAERQAAVERAAAAAAVEALLSFVCCPVWGKC